MDKPIQQKNILRDTHTAQVLIDLFAAHEESLHSTTETDTSLQSIVNLDTDNAIDFEHLDSARIYPRTTENKTTEFMQLNIDEIQKTCITALRGAQKYSSVIITAIIRGVLRADTAIASYIDLVTEKQKTKRHGIKQMKGNTKIKVEQVDQVTFRHIPVHTRSRKPKLTEYKGTRLDMLFFICKAVLTKIITG